MENKSNSKSSLLPLIFACILLVPILWPLSFSDYFYYLPFARGIMLVLSLIFVYRQKTLSIITSIIALLLSVAQLISIGFFRTIFRSGIRFRYIMGWLDELYIILLIVLLLVYAIHPSETKKKLFPILTFGVLVIVCIVLISRYNKLHEEFGEYFQISWRSTCLTISHFYTLFAFALSQTQSMGLTKVLTKTHAINATKTLASLETLEKLAGLKQQGILSNEDYEKKKQEIMRQF